MYVSWPQVPPPPLCIMLRKCGFWVLLHSHNSMTFHLSTHLLPGHRVSHMLRRGLPRMWVICQGSPTPTFRACTCVSRQVFVCTISRNLWNFVASPRQVSVTSCVSSAHAGSHTLEAGASWSQQCQPSISPMRHACHPTLCSICAPLPWTLTHYMHRHSIQWRLYSIDDFRSLTCMLLILPHTQNTQK